MKILVATTKTQGVRKNDFTFCNPEEMVFPGLICDHETADESCGCARSLTGVDSHKGTTTAIVVNLPLWTFPSMAKKVLQSYHDAGWSTWTLGDAEELIEAQRLKLRGVPVDSVIEYRDGFYSIREMFTPCKQGKHNLGAIRCSYSRTKYGISATCSCPCHHSNGLIRRAM